MDAVWLHRLLPLRTRWHRRDFQHFWTPLTVSLFSTPVTLLARPTVALLLLLRASPVEVGVLGAFPPLAYHCCGVPASVLVDRLSRRVVMVTADLGRACPGNAAVGVRAWHPDHRADVSRRCHRG